jgi:hypothetical protein
MHLLICEANAALLLTEGYFTKIVLLICKYNSLSHSLSNSHSKKPTPTARVWLRRAESKEMNMIHLVLQCWVLWVLQTAAATGNANLKFNPATGTLEITAPLVSVREQ